jgi:hypothetical protein
MLQTILGFMLCLVDMRLGMGEYLFFLGIWSLRPSPKASPSKSGLGCAGPAKVTVNG